MNHSTYFFLLLLIAVLLVAGSPICAESGVELKYKGFDLFEIGKYAEALEMYNQSLKLEPDDTFTWFEYAKLWKEKGKVVALYEHSRNYKSIDFSEAS